MEAIIKKSLTVALPLVIGAIGGMFYAAYPMLHAAFCVVR